MCVAVWAFYSCIIQKDEQNILLCGFQTQYTLNLGTGVLQIQIF